MRYYGALMTSKLLPEGTIDYNRLSDLCMIVIAGFDMGGEGKYRYTVRRMYEGYPDAWQAFCTRYNKLKKRYKDNRSALGRFSGYIYGQKTRKLKI